ncbi:NADPH-dependent F420 reductase [Actinoplanes sp. NPDC049596]|uniref:NADPH-dependent F420 reductase n=1 Tax=unclassified Actinoplanes TaxID=2626549 RepID=UPI00341EAACA
MSRARRGLSRSMTTIGFIGSGYIGGTVARLAVAAGYDVVVSNSRGPETLKELVDELGPKARAATATEAAAAGDIVVVSVPFKAFDQLPVAELTGKVVLDTNNYYPQRDGHFEALDAKSTTSAALEQEHLAGAKLVKVFNNINYKHLASLARPAGAPDRSALPIAGDDETAKQTATEFLTTIGYDAVDTGSLAESWRQEPGQPVYGPPYGTYEDPIGTPADADTIRKAVAAAQR